MSALQHSSPGELTQRLVPPASTPLQMTRHPRLAVNVQTRCDQARNETVKDATGTCTRSETRKEPDLLCPACRMALLRAVTTDTTRVTIEAFQDERAPESGLNDHLMNILSAKTTRHPVSAAKQWQIAGITSRFEFEYRKRTAVIMWATGCNRMPRTYISTTAQSNTDFVHCCVGNERSIQRLCTC